jgi:ABC-type multidrug transport system fused ATPase/permease subunit
VLATCTEPLAPGAPDLRGVWRTVSAVQAEQSSSRAMSVLRHLFWKALGVERTRTPVPDGHPIYLYAERIEQCGNRIVDMGGGTVADARADGTEENGVHDVSAFDFTTPIDVTACSTPPTSARRSDVSAHRRAPRRPTKRHVATPTHAIELIGVSRVHGAGRAQVPALSDVTLVIEAGEHVSLIGPSVSGKSTIVDPDFDRDQPSPSPSPGG